MVLEGKRKRGEDGGKGLEMKKVKEAKGYLLRLEPEAQASRLWWMVGFIAVSIASGRFCLADLGKAGGLEEDGGKRRWEGRKGKGVKGEEKILKGAGKMGRGRIAFAPCPLKVTTK